MSTRSQTTFASIQDTAITCEVCNVVIPQVDGLLDRCCRIERGDFDLGDRGNDNVKVDLFVCQDCYLSDPDLGRFFNRIGKRVR